MKRITCRVAGHRISTYRAMRTPNLVAMGCHRCGAMVSLSQDRWGPNSDLTAVAVLVLVSSAGMTLIAVLLGWTS